MEYQSPEIKLITIKLLFTSFHKREKSKRYDMMLFSSLERLTLIIQ